MASSYTLTRSDEKCGGSSRLIRVRVAWTADTDGSFTSATFILSAPCFLVCVDTDPGSTAPTDNYDIAITNDLGIDIAGAATVNRDTTNSERVRPLDANALTSMEPAYGTITVAITNNSVNAATGTIDMYFYCP